MDPLLVAAPTLLLLSAVTLLGAALSPLLFRLAERASDRPGLGVAVGARLATRAPRTVLPLTLVVALAAACVCSALVQRASHEATRQARVAYQVGADVRVIAPAPARRDPVAAERAELRRVDGVRSVSGVWRELDFLEDVPVEVLVSEPAGPAPGALLAAADESARLVTELSHPDGDRVPAVATARLAEQTSTDVGDVVQVDVAGRPTAVEVVGLVPYLRTVAPDREGLLLGAGAVAPLRDAAPPLEWWLDTADARMDEVAAKLERRPTLSDQVLSPAGVADRMAAGPATGGRALDQLLAVTAAGSVLVGAVVLGAVLVLRRRRREEQAAFLRALGAGGRDVTATLLVEYAVTAVVGAVVGLVAGLAVAAVTVHSTASGAGGEALVPGVRLAVPWAAVLAALAVVVLAPVPALRNPLRGRGAQVLPSREHHLGAARGEA